MRLLTDTLITKLKNGVEDWPIDNKTIIAYQNNTRIGAFALDHVIQRRIPLLQVIEVAWFLYDKCPELESAL